MEYILFDFMNRVLALRECQIAWLSVISRADSRCLLMKASSIQI